jgi:hypothetical protein
VLEVTILSDDSNFEVFEDNGDYGSSEKVNFIENLMRQIERINWHLSKLNETPHFIWAAYTKPEANFNPEDIKPNRDNFIYSVIALRQMLVPYMMTNKLYLKKERQLLDSNYDDITTARERYSLLISLMSEEGLLPLRSRG